MFEMLPDTRIRVEFRRVSWKPPQMNLLPPASSQEALALIRTGDGDTIPKHQQFAAQLPAQMTPKGPTSSTGQGTSALHCRQLPAGRDPTQHREVIPLQQRFQERRLSTWGISPDHTRQQIKPRFIHAHNDAPFATCLFFNAGHTSSRQRAISFGSRRLSCGAGFCGVQLRALSNRQTGHLWYATLNSQAITCATRSQVHR